MVVSGGMAGSTRRGGNRLSSNPGDAEDARTLEDLRRNPGKIIAWKGNLCSCDDRGRLVIRSPKVADARLASRLVATFGARLENLRGVRELPEGTPEGEDI